MHERKPLGTWIARAALATSFFSAMSQAQLVTWVGTPTGVWNDPDNWSSGVVPNSATVEPRIDSGNVQNSAVTLDIAAIVQSLQVDGSDQLTIAADTSLTASTFINNAGAIEIAFDGALDANTLGTLNITAGGTILMQGATSRIGGTGRIQNQSNTISGAGLIGNNSAAFTNDFVIDASAPGQSLVLDPGNLGASAFINNGTMSAGNGILVLSGNGGGEFLNTNGRIIANGSRVNLQLGASVAGGTFSTSAGGRVSVPAGHSATVNSIANTGHLRIDAGATLTVGATINNTGSIEINAANASANMHIFGSVNFQGVGGELILNQVGAGNATVTSTANGFLTNGSGHTIRGAGVAVNDQNLTNDGRISADVNGQSLLVAPHFGLQFNNGEMRAINGGTLILSGQFGGGIFNTGIITAGSGSSVELSNNINISLGDLSGSGSFIVNSGSNARLSNVHFGAPNMLVDNDSLVLDNTITNDGMITVEGTGPAAIIRPLLNTSNVQLMGSGTISLTGTSARIDGPGRITNGPNHRIQGGGFVGNDTLAITNNGTIMAFDPSTFLIVDPGGGTLLHNGSFVARNLGTLRLSGNGGQSFTGPGQIIIDTGATMQFTNQAAVDFTGPSLVDGSMLVIGSSSVSLSTIAGSGTVALFTPATLSAQSIRVDTLNINAGTTTIRAGSGTLGTSVVKSLLVANALDLTDNAMVVDYTGSSPFNAVTTWLTTGYAGGSWNGVGIQSSIATANSLHNTGVGSAEASDIFTIFPAPFAGQMVDGDSVLMRYTLYGDCDLDGTVRIGDFARLAAAFNQPGSKWSRGDFNYDGITNIADFAQLAANFNQSLPAELPRGSVPEPAQMAIALAGIPWLLKRSRGRDYPAVAN